MDGSELAWSEPIADIGHCCRTVLEYASIRTSRHHTVSEPYTLMGSVVRCPKVVETSKEPHGSIGNSRTHCSKIDT